MKERQIVSAQEMRILDKLTVTEKEITSYELMQQAGRMIYKHICRNGVCDISETILIVAGVGNNGGDALIVGLHLIERGLKPLFVIIGKEENQSHESKQAISNIIENNFEVTRIDTIKSINIFKELIEQSSIVVDGIFGIGLMREVEGYYKEVINLINQSYAQVVSIDIPSGINADNGLVLGIAVKADVTVIIQNYKQGNLLNDALDYSGEMHLLDIGILQTLFPEKQALLNKSYLKNKLPKRIKNTHKYNYGNILTIGGSKGMMGAPLMAAYAALRTGAGLSSVSYNDKYLNHIHNPYPVIMVNTYLGLEDIPSQTQKKTAIIFGPGLGKDDEINLKILSYLLSLETPLVVDADGIYYLKQLIHDYSERENIIVTPHNKEMATFLGIDIEDIKHEPVLFAKNIAHKYNLTVVLKGSCTIITNNDDTYFSIGGNPGMATAGTGDVLSGIIGSLLGRGFSPMEAAKIGVLIHSKAGELAVNKYGEESLIATDLTQLIPKVLKSI